jgi:hypothetical protein
VNHFTFAAVRLFLAASVWQFGALLQWSHLRMQESLLAALECVRMWPSLLLAFRGPYLTRRSHV